MNQNPQLNNANNIKSNPNHNFLLKKNSNQHRMINSRTNKKIASPPKSHKRQIGLKLGYTFCVSWIAKDVETKSSNFRQFVAFSRETNRVKRTQNKPERDKDRTFVSNETRVTREWEYILELAVLEFIVPTRR